MEEQSIRFTSVGGRRVAWATVGEGPPLVIGGWWMSHLEFDWQDPGFRAFVDVLARHRTVVRYDRPGTGLSGRDGPPPAGIDEEVAVLVGVVDALGPGPIDAFAASSGAPVAAAFAAEHPDQVNRMVLYGAYANGAEIAGPEARDSILGLIRDHWGLGSRVLTDVFMPSATGTERAAFAAFQRKAASTDVAVASLRAVYSFDVGDRLEAIRAPVTVVHRREDRAIRMELGRDLAARIPGATFVALEGGEHFPWRGSSGEVLVATLRGLGIEDIGVAVAAPPAEPEALAVGDDGGDLSPRELEVLRLVAIGLSDREIADQLVLSPHTVHRHVANIRTKLRLPSRGAAAVHAARLGLI